MIQTLLLTVLLCPGQVIVAADDSPKRWQDKAEFHCRDEADDAVTLREAAVVAAKDREVLVLGPGNYEQQSTVEIGPGVAGVVGNGASLRPAWGADHEDRWLMVVRNVQRAKIEGIEFYGRGNGKGLLIDHCTDSEFRRLKLVACTQALKVDRGWCTYLEALRISYCRRPPDDPLTEPTVELNGFSSSSFRGIAIVYCETQAPILAVSGSQNTLSEIAIEDSTSDDSIIRLTGGRHATIEKLHFENTIAPVQIRAVDSRQGNLRGYSFGHDFRRPVEVGVLLTNCQETVVDSVIASYCTDAIVRVDFKSRGCPYPTRISLHYPREVYTSQPNRDPPKHIVDFQGSK